MPSLWEYILNQEEIAAELRKLDKDVHRNWYDYEGGYYAYKNGIAALLKKMELNE